MSKQLDSILKNIPPATVIDEKSQLTRGHGDELASIDLQAKEPTERIVAVVPKSLKKEIKTYLAKHPGQTERTIILKALKLLGFNVEPAWLIDKRSKR